MKKKLIVFAICCSLLIVASVAILIPKTATTAYASTSILNDWETQELLENTIIEIEEDLADKDTDVLTELHLSLNRYHSMLLNANFDDHDKIQNLIATTQTLIDEYEMYLAQKSFGIAPRGSFHIIWTPAITAIVAGFLVEGWDLAAELLMFNMSNNVKGIHYQPVNGQIVANSSFIRTEIATSNKVIDSKTMPGAPWWGYIPLPSISPLDVLKFDADSHYALGDFTYRKTYHDSTRVNITIKDLYDWDPNSTYGSELSASLLATCYNAQQAGVLVPFYTVINNIIVPGTVPFNHSLQTSSATITGKGHFSSVDIPYTIPNFWYDDLKNDNNMPLLPVTTIEKNAFANTNLERLTFTIPSNIKTIDDFAFSGCRNLGLNGSVLDIPYSVTYIYNSAFKDCVNLQRVSLPSGLKWIGESAFENCAKLLEINIPSNLTTINQSVFKNCTNLRTIEIPFEMTEIRANAFYGCEKLTIHSKGNAKLPGWNNSWNSSNRPVIWGYDAAQWKTATNGALKANTPTKINFDFYIVTGCADYDADSYEWHSFGEIELIDSVKFYYRGIEITVSITGGSIKIQAKDYYESSHRLYERFIDWRIKSGATVKQYTPAASWKIVANGSLNPNLPTRINLEVMRVTGNNGSDDSYYEWINLGWVEFTGSMSKNFSQLGYSNPITISIVGNSLKVSGNGYQDKGGYYELFCDWQLGAGTTIQQYTS